MKYKIKLFFEPNIGILNTNPEERKFHTGDNNIKKKNLSGMSSFIFPTCVLVNREELTDYYKQSAHEDLHDKMISFIASDS